MHRADVKRDRDEPRCRDTLAGGLRAKIGQLQLQARSSCTHASPSSPAPNRRATCQNLLVEISTRTRASGHRGNVNLLGTK